MIISLNRKQQTIHALLITYLMEDIKKNILSIKVGEKFLNLKFTLQWLGDDYKGPLTETTYRNRLNQLRLYYLEKLVNDMEESVNY